jgi:hypothetical protein
LFIKLEFSGQLRVNALYGTLWGIMSSELRKKSHRLFNKVPNCRKVPYCSKANLFIGDKFRIAAKFLIAKKFRIVA